MRLRLPLIVISYLPKKWQDKYIDYVWDTKTDEEILKGFLSRTTWVDLSLNKDFGECVSAIAEEALDILDKRILPQMRKRGLFKTK